MKVVHYEYRLKTYNTEGDIAVQLVAKQIRHYSDVVDFLPSGDLMPVKHPKKWKTKIASRYYFGTANNARIRQDMLSAENGKLLSNCSKKSWSTSLKKF